MEPLPLNLQTKAIYLVNYGLKGSPNTLFYYDNFKKKLFQ